VTIAEPRNPQLSDNSFTAYGNVSGKDICQLSAWVEAADGEQIFGQPLNQELDAYDWAFHFQNVQTGVVYKLFVQAICSCGCVARDMVLVVYWSFAEQIIVRIAYPGNGVQVPGAYFETAGSTNDTTDPCTAEIMRGGATIANGTAIPPGPIYQWKFSFRGVSPTPGGQPTDTLKVTVTQSPQNFGFDQKNIKIV
jgi:hypothetical protein